MKILKIDGMNPEPDKIEIAKRFIKNGSIVIYPTDTVYGIGANIYDEKALLNVFSIKKRPINKALSICLSKIEDIELVANLNSETEDMVRKILPGPFTLILEKNNDLSSVLTGGSNFVGIRIPDNKVCKELSSDFPITSTSANLSGYPIPESPDGVIKQLDSSIDLLLDAGICKDGLPSTVIDMTVYPPKVKRKGAGDHVISKIKY
jgi:L-threonylcarbamoyladenylate synthase